MRIRSSVLRWSKGLLLVLLVVGCHSGTPDLKPPKQPDDFRLPPLADKRFSQPTVYPKETLDTDFSNRPKVNSADNMTPSKFGTPGMYPGGLSRGY